MNEGINKTEANTSLFEEQLIKWKKVRRIRK